MEILGRMRVAVEMLHFEFTPLVDRTRFERDAKGQKRSGAARISRTRRKAVAFGALWILCVLCACGFGQSMSAPDGAVDCSNLTNASLPACSPSASAPGSSTVPGTPASPSVAQFGVPANNAQGPPNPEMPKAMRRDRLRQEQDDTRAQLLANSSAAETSLPPAPPTQFQRMVQGAVGELLPIFGSKLFSNVPATFAPVQRIPVTQDYVIGPGDEIALRVWGSVNFHSRLAVDRTGSVYVPQVGEIHVAGLRFSQLDGYLRDQLRPIFRNFDLSANMGKLRSIQIFAVGQARRPGSYTLSSLSTVMNAIFATGGPTPHGTMRRIQVVRGDQVVTTFDLYDLLLKGHAAQNVPLQSGDVIYIPSVGPLIAVAGSVNVPAIYELKGQETVGEAIQLAGGESTMAAPQPAQLEQTNAAGSRYTVDLSLDPMGLKTLLRSGDILRIPSIALRFDKTVTLRGNVANPGRYAWRPGMRIEDLIPDRHSLETRDYWQHRIALGLPAPEYTPLTKAQGESSQKNDLIHTAPDVDWQYAVVERIDAETLKSSLISFDLGQAIANKNSSQNIELRPDDVVTIFSTSNIQVPQNQRTKYVHLLGEFVHAGVYSVLPGETLRQLVERAGGFTPQAYVYASQFLRVSTQQQQQVRLDQYLDELQREVQDAASNKASSTVHPEAAAAISDSNQSQLQMIGLLRKTHPSGRIVLQFTPYSSGIRSVPELPLEDGDRFIVPSIPATVNVIGAVYNQDSYQYFRGERVGDYLKQAGGPSRDADRRHEFVIRANGSILSKQYAGGTIFSGGLNDKYIYPGDSVVVPTAINKTTFLRGLSDWSTVFSQFGLGIAALTILGL
jgi:polysaccharide biosynthesis/export protein